KVSILKNNGNGTFQAPVKYGVGYDPHSVFCADLDGDGDLDLAVANFLSSPSWNVSILKNNGDGTFQTAVNYGAGQSAWCVFCADLDGDGDLDLAVTNRSGNNVSILKNNGDGTFQTAVNYGAGNVPSSVFCADLDGDGDLDLAVSNADSNVSILKNNGNGTFQAPVKYYTGGAGVQFCADLDGDGDLDLAGADYYGGAVSILKNNGNGTFQAPVKYAGGLGYYVGGITCGDLDGDGDLDLAVESQTNTRGPILSILKNNGDGTFQTAVNYSTGGTVGICRFPGDLDGHGDLDLAVAVTGDTVVGIFLNRTSEYTDVNEGKYNEKVGTFSLDQNYPNPFNQATKIEFTLQHPSLVNLNIYDVLGRKVRTLIFKDLSSGYKSVLWDGKDNSGNDVASGVYFYQLKVKDFSQTKKMVLIK
ncbi:MAG: FG-GAP-like repeat-containing protein, partial [Desulfobacterales bacterium]|nr:FG-GAP-like repeat-containing protein [Desulfobacterales bacterium]